MKATDVLKQQHQEVRGLFQRLEKASDEDDQSELFEELASNLIAHDLIEREIFYPACEEAPGLSGLVEQALAEHDVMQFSLYQADEAQAEDAFPTKCAVLKELVMHHLGEEEQRIFPKVEQELGPERLEEMGDLLEQRFEEAQEEDFRVALHDSLTDAMSGLMQASARRQAGRRPHASR